QRQMCIRDSEAHPDRVTCAIGVHPHDAKNLDDAFFEALATTVADPRVKLVGEIGLDYHYDNSPREAQKEAFRRQIALARAVKKPIVVHTREAREDTLAVLREENARDVGGILHCFSEDPAFAKAALDLGFVASFSGIATFKSAGDVREAARLQPLDALLVETDAPYLAPIPFRGKRNEPAYVLHTAREIAALRGIPVEELAEAAWNNSLRLFG
ncbi:MAG: TatD family hydrolase, partial [Candidatus Eisenbacteria bacterium]|nr:TatD family hydrolase [Candidatus Eisenbacteria bacterium]